MIAHGGDVALVFTRLGEATRHGHGRSRDESRCDFAVPLTVPEGYFFSSWAQSVQYGVVKPAGVAAGLDVQSSLRASRGPAFSLPTLARVFDRSTAVDIALDELASESTTAVDGLTHGGGLQKHWCKKNRGSDHELRGTARTWAERTTSTGADPAVIIAIDGLDMRADFDGTLEACPAR